MADHSEVAYTTADGNDYVAHEQTYLGFLTLVKWGTISVIVIARADGYLPHLIGSCSFQAGATAHGGA